MGLVRALDRLPGIATRISLVKHDRANCRTCSVSDEEKRVVCEWKFKLRYVLLKLYKDHLGARM